MMTTDRDKLIGGHVTPEVKNKLKEEAKMQNISVSLYLYRLLLEKFKMKEAA